LWVGFILGANRVKRGGNVSLNKLASIIAKIEGKKSQARIGDIREILRILVDIEREFSLSDKAPSYLFEVWSQKPKRARRVKK
jgi:hypothetical protein